MRVLFVTGEYPPMQGGVGDYTWSLGRALTALGVDVHVLTSYEAGPSHLTPPGAGVVYPDIHSWRWGLAGQVRRLAAEIQPDVLHIQYQSAAFDLHPAINLLPRSLHKSAWPRRVAATFHDLRTPYIFPKAGPLRWRANLELATRSDAVIATNAEDLARLREVQELAGKLHEAPIGANIQPDPPEGFQRDAQRARWGAGPDDLLLCYFGFLNESKGGEELMLALARLVASGISARLLMVGGQVGASDPTNQAYLRRVQALLDERGLSERVRWTGFTPAAEVSANLFAADIAMLPYRDGASFRRGSLMAAIAHAMPVISTEPVVTIPDLRHGENIWLAPARSPDALAEAAAHLWREPALRRQLSQGARQLAGQFTWDAIAERHIEIYRELA
ncbi:MAG TPA: glycosyltransferase family 4 protein [Anaerolineae bacterium]|nr:glycosyltransferase family 4 protein [Anaerolineae bacterium]